MRRKLNQLHKLETDREEEDVKEEEEEEAVPLALFMLSPLHEKKAQSAAQAYSDCTTCMPAMGKAAGSSFIVTVLVLLIRANVLNPDLAYELVLLIRPKVGFATVTVLFLLIRLNAFQFRPRV
eukprot:gene13905-19833_t